MNVSILFVHSEIQAWTGALWRDEFVGKLVNLIWREASLEWWLLLSSYNRVTFYDFFHVISSVTRSPYSWTKVILLKLCENSSHLNHMGLFIRKHRALPKKYLYQTKIWIEEHWIFLGVKTPLQLLKVATEPHLCVPQNPIPGTKKFKLAISAYPCIKNHKVT